MTIWFLGHGISKRSRESALGATQPGTMLAPHRGVATVRSPLCHTTDDRWCWVRGSRTSTTACSKLHSSTFNLMKADTAALASFLTGSEACILVTRETGKGAFSLFYFWGFEEFLKFGMDDQKMLMVTNVLIPGGKGEGGLRTASKVSHLVIRDTVTKIRGLEGEIHL